MKIDFCSYILVIIYENKSSIYLIKFSKNNYDSSMRFFIDNLLYDNFGTKVSKELIKLFISNTLDDYSYGFYIKMSVSVIVHFF